MKGYCEALASEGVDGYGVERATDDLAVGLIHNVMVYVLSMPIVDLESSTKEEATGASVLDATFTWLERWSSVALTPCDKREKGVRTLRPLHEAQPDARRATLGGGSGISA